MASNNKLSSAKLEMWAQQLLTAAQLFAPNQVASARAALGVVKGLSESLRLIRDNDPEAWAQISADYNNAVSGLGAAIARAESVPGEVAHNTDVIDEFDTVPGTGDTNPDPDGDGSITTPGPVSGTQPGPDTDRN